MSDAGIEPMTSCATPILPTEALICLTLACVLPKSTSECLNAVAGPVGRNSAYSTTETFAVSLYERTNERGGKHDARVHFTTLITQSREATAAAA